jgi:hypothetical protein
VCIGCRGFLVFAASGRLRKPTSAEQREFDADSRLAAVRIAIKRARAKFN